MPRKKFHMETGEHYIRRDDNSTNYILVLQEIETGEVHLKIHDRDTGEEMLVGFTDYIGGGHSPNILKALKNLALAIERDNKENPL